MPLNIDSVSSSTQDSRPERAGGPGIDAVDRAGIEFHGSSGLAQWMADQSVSLAFTTYQAGKLFLIGRRPDLGLAVFERSYDRCMGLCASADAQTLYMSTLYQLWRLENILEEARCHEGHDRLYIPQLAYTTGHIDIHDIGLDRDGTPVFVNTLFNCLATVSERASFEVLWRPPFISGLVAEDRCHLNGLAMLEGRPRYLTAVSRSNAADGWRAGRTGEGVVVDFESNQIVAKGLSMPHSPRVYEDRLWVLDSGHGHLGYIDTRRGRFEPVTFCPGYLRGLSFISHFAVVGLSLPRNNRTFQGLGLDQALQGGGHRARCGLQIIDLRTGELVHWLYIDGVVEELYDVIVLPGVIRPQALGFKTKEIQHILSIA